MITRRQGFTLVEILVVISIIVLVMSMAAPAITGFSQQRRLKEAAQTIQAAFMQARALAIGVHQEVKLVFFVRNNLTGVDLDSTNTNDTLKKGEAGSIHIFQPVILSNGNKEFLAYGQVLNLPEFTSLERVPAPGNVSNPGQAIFTIYPDGSIGFPNDKDNDPEISTDTDIIVGQQDLDGKCYVNVVRNTGRAIFAVR